MIDLPNFVLSTLKEFGPADACIQRVDKFRFKIQSRNAEALSVFTTRQCLELVLSEPLVASYQWAVASHDQSLLTEYAENMREQVAKQLTGRDGEAYVLIQLL